jgi:hypothetical protein
VGRRLSTQSLDNLSADISLLVSRAKTVSNYSLAISPNEEWIFVELFRDSGPFPDASLNPPANPVHTFHLGLWFNSPNDAAAAGCASNVTPFNGEHDAGIQVLNTSNFADDEGPSGS